MEPPSQAQVSCQAASTSQAFWNMWRLSYWTSPHFPILRKESLANSGRSPSQLWVLRVLCVCVCV